MRSTNSSLHPARAALPPAACHSPYCRSCGRASLCFHELTKLFYAFAVYLGYPVACRAQLSSICSITCALLNSLCALFCTRFLCFQWFAHSFAKTPGWGYPRPVLAPLSVRRLTRARYDDCLLGARGLDFRRNWGRDNANTSEILGVRGRGGIRYGRRRDIRGRSRSGGERESRERR